MLDINFESNLKEIVHILFRTGEDDEENARTKATAEAMPGICGRSVFLLPAFDRKL